MTFRKRLAHLAALVAILLAATPFTPAASAHPAPEWIDEIIVDRVAAHGVPGWYWWVWSTLHCESAHWRPRPVGAQGELGPAQLHPAGKLPVFYRLGYSDPFDWFEATDFLVTQFIAGQSRHWSCA